MANDMRALDLEPPQEPCCVLDQVQNAERVEVAVVAPVPAAGLAVAALVGSDGVEAGGGERRHYLAPAEADLRKAVQQKHRRLAALARLEHMHAEAVDAVEAAAADAGGQLQRRKMRSALPPRTFSRTSPGSASTRDRHPAMSPMVCG